MRLREVNILAILYVLLQECEGLHIATILHKEAKLNEARDGCRMDGYRGPLVGENNDTYNTLIKIMKKNNIPTLWVGIHRQIVIFPKLDDGDVGDDQENVESVPTEAVATCSYLDIRDGRVHKSPCRDPNRLRSPICEKKECIMCPGLSNNKNRTCRVLNTSCFFIHCTEVTGYEAKRICLTDASELYVDEDSDLTYKLSVQINQMKDIQCNDKYWIGEHNIFWTKASTGTIQEPETSRWLPGEPKDCSLCGCAVLVKHEDQYGWKAVSCNESHPYVCSAKDEHGEGRANSINEVTLTPSLSSFYNNQSEPNDYQSENQSTRVKESDGTSIKIWGIAVLIIGSIMFLVGLILLAYRGTHTTRGTAAEETLIKQKQDSRAKAITAEIEKLKEPGGFRNGSF